MKDPGFAQAFIVRLQKDESARSEDRLIGLLDTLFTSSITPEEKKTVLSQEFQIPVTEHIERAVANMCNYSSFIRNQGLQEGLQQGMQEGIQQGMQQGVQKGMQQMAVANIKSLMGTLGISAQQAMTALNIPAEDRAKYAEML